MDGRIFPFQFTYAYSTKEHYEHRENSFEVSKPSKETQLGFNPDRLMGRETKEAKSEVKTTETGKLIDFDKFITRSTDKFELRDLPQHTRNGTIVLR